MQYDLAKYRNINISDSAPAIKLFHHHQQLIHDSRQENGLDPYPLKHIANWKPLVEAMGQMMKALTRR